MRRVIDVQRVDTKAKAVIYANIENSSVEYRVLSDIEEVRKHLKHILENFIFTLEPENKGKDAIYKAKVAIPDTKEHLITLIDLLSWNGYAVLGIKDDTTTKSLINQDEQNEEPEIVLEHDTFSAFKEYLKSLNATRREVLKSVPSVDMSKYIETEGDKTYLIRVPAGYILKTPEGKVLVGGQLVGRIPVEELINRGYSLIPVNAAESDDIDELKAQANKAIEDLKKILRNLPKELIEKLSILKPEDQIKLLNHYLKENEKVREPFNKAISALVEFIVNHLRKFEPQMSENEAIGVSLKEILELLQKELNAKIGNLTLTSGDKKLVVRLPEILKRNLFSGEEISQDELRKFIEDYKKAENVLTTLSGQAVIIPLKDGKEGFKLVKATDVLLDDSLKEVALSSKGTRVISDNFTRDPELLRSVLENPKLLVSPDKVNLLDEEKSKLLEFFVKHILSGSEVVSERNIEYFFYEYLEHLMSKQDEYFRRSFPSTAMEFTTRLIDDLKFLGVENLPITMLLPFMYGKELTIRPGSLLDVLLKSGVFTMDTRKIAGKLRAIPQTAAKLTENQDREKLDSQTAIIKKQKAEKAIGEALSSLNTPKVEEAKLQGLLQYAEQVQSLVEEYIRPEYISGAPLVANKYKLEKSEEISQEVSDTLRKLFFAGERVVNKGEFLNNVKNLIDRLLKSKLISQNMAKQLESDLHVLGEKLLSEAGIEFSTINTLTDDEREQLLNSFARVTALLTQNLHGKDVNNKSIGLMDSFIEEDAKRIREGKFLSGFLEANKNSPGGISLYYYQYYGIVLATNKALFRHTGGALDRVGTALFWEGGLGKTVSILAVIALAKDLGIVDKNKPVLVFTPENVADQWVKEVVDFFNGQDVSFGKDVSGRKTNSLSARIIRGIRKDYRLNMYKLLALEGIIAKLEDDIRKTPEEEKEKRIEALTKVKELKEAYKSLTGRDYIGPPDVVVIGISKASRETGPIYTPTDALSTDIGSLLTLSGPMRVGTMSVLSPNMQQKQILEINHKLDSGIFGGLIVDEAGLVMRPTSVRARNLMLLKTRITSDSNKGVSFVLNAEEFSRTPDDTVQLLRFVRYHGESLNTAVYTKTVPGSSKATVLKIGALANLRAYSSRVTNDSVFGPQISGRVSKKISGVEEETATLKVQDKKGKVEIEVSIPKVSSTVDNRQINIIPFSADTYKVPFALQTLMSIHGTIARRIRAQNQGSSKRGAKEVIAPIEAGIYYRSEDGSIKRNSVDYSADELEAKYRPSLMQFETEANLGIVSWERYLEYGFADFMQVRMVDTNPLTRIRQKGDTTGVFDYQAFSSADSSKFKNMTAREAINTAASEVYANVYGIEDPQKIAEFNQKFNQAFDALLKSIRISLGSGEVRVKEIADISNYPQSVLGYQRVSIDDKDLARVFGSADINIYFPNLAKVVDTPGADIDDEELAEALTEAPLETTEELKGHNLRKTFIEARNKAVKYAYTLAFLYASGRMPNLDLNQPLVVKYFSSEDTVTAEFFYRECDESGTCEEKSMTRALGEIKETEQNKKILEWIRDMNSVYVGSKMNEDEEEVTISDAIEAVLNFYTDQNVYFTHKDKIDEVVNRIKNNKGKYRVLIGTPSRKHALSLQRILIDSVGKEHYNGTIVGGLDNREQQAIMGRHRGEYNIPMVTVFTSKAAGRGVNMPSDYEVIFAEPSNEYTQQAIARGFRPADFVRILSSTGKKIQKLKGEIEDIRRSIEKAKPDVRKRLEERLKTKEMELKDLMNYYNGLKVDIDVVVTASNYHTILQRLLQRELQKKAYEPTHERRVGNKTRVIELSEGALAKIDELAKKLAEWSAKERTEAFLSRVFQLIGHMKVNYKMRGQLSSEEQYVLDSLDAISRLRDAYTKVRGQLLSEQVQDLRRELSEYFEEDVLKRLFDPSTGFFSV